jgi:hypothetical protein
VTDGPTLFAPTLEALLSGAVICEPASPDLFHFLENGAHRTEVEQYLEQLRRGLRHTSDRLAWFAVYLDLDEASVRGTLAQRFGETINDLEPLVAWLRATSLVRSSGTTLQAGDELRTSALIDAIEQAPALADELKRLSATRLFKNTQSTPKGQLEAILNRLVERGYLVTRDRAKSRYIATGQWSRLYDVLAFIQAHEQIEIDSEPSDEQGALDL